MKTYASMIFIFNGREYPYEFDFGKDYPLDSAEFMFTEGNYGCDCNRLLMLGRKYPELNIDQQSISCGEDIQMIKFRAYKK